MGSRARQPPSRQRDLPPRFATQPLQNRQPQSARTNSHNNDAWNPPFRKNPHQSELKSVNSATVQRQVENVRTLLSRLTTDNSEKLVLELESLNLKDDPYVATETARMLFEKAVGAESDLLTASCARLVHQFVSRLKVTSVNPGLLFAKKLRKGLLDICQLEFQKTTAQVESVNELEVKVATATDSGRKRELELEMRERVAKEVRKKVGNVRLLGELFKLQWLTPRIMVEMVQTLLGRKDARGKNCLESVFQVIELLKSVGEVLEAKLEELSWRQKNGDRSLRFVPERNWMEKVWSQVKELEKDRRLDDNMRSMIGTLEKLRENHYNWEKLIPKNLLTSAETVAVDQRQVQPRQPGVILQQERHQQEPGAGFVVSTSNRFQFLGSPGAGSGSTMDQQQVFSVPPLPDFFAPVTVSNGVPVDQQLFVELEEEQERQSNGVSGEELEEAAEAEIEEEAPIEPEVNDTQVTEAAQAILQLYLTTKNLENVHELISIEFQEPGKLTKFVSFVLEYITTGNCKTSAELSMGGELIKSLVESDSNALTFKEIVAVVQNGVMQDISRTVEEKQPKAALYLVNFLAQVMGHQPRFAWLRQLASGLGDAETFSKTKSLEVLRNAVTVLSSMLRL